MRRFLTGARVFNGDRFLNDTGILLADGKVEALLPATATPEGAEIVRFSPDAIIVPGFLDLQVNGAGGVLFNETPTADAARRIAEAVRPHGVTGVLPTLITDSKEALEAACSATGEAIAAENSGVLGVHIEGPFISVERKGVHNPDYIRQPDQDDLDLISNLAKDLNENDARILLTIAPENVADEALAQLASNGVVLSAGHTAASYERTVEATRNGVTGFTHLGNAMPPIQNRAPGPVAAALSTRDTYCGLIADGIHVHAGLMKVMLAAKPQGRIFLVTDAMPPVGTDAETFILYGQTIYRRDGRLTTADGTLAGADIDMASALRNCVTMLDVPLDEALRMASLYPASFIGLEKKYGRIAPGYAADFAIINDDVEPLETYVAGNSVWSKD
ncbi:N-acetylglucosamine-6-phosphate deacetylase [Pseudovibrio sp. SPO723]|uniref:N-acetylglucosamine-6-phosphate deacetylase n=1 Tax=Nesiotobacter zosterae TaxID=392721 RepID=UPI0029C5E624|nr:N-acetylglucosamine-6-phosphate deacetylase [Pseudovibrio sp. SPO723]MDX5594803.1 N-acetylglucosamine-6-phosphate deacetylase [Pseudovibrio sp. SPO723]